MFVGAAPNFKKIGIESTIHTVAAIFAAICSIIWSCVIISNWTSIVIWLILFLILALCTKSLKSSYIFWLEMVAFFTLYNALLIYVIIT